MTPGTIFDQPHVRERVEQLTRERDAAIAEAERLHARAEQADDFQRERDDANERARLAIVRADIVQRERDEARAAIHRVSALMEERHKLECDRLRALLRECRQVIEDYADPMWNERGVLVWSLTAREDVVKRIDVALEGRDDR